MYGLRSRGACKVDKQPTLSSTFKVRKRKRESCSKIENVCPLESELLPVKKLKRLKRSNKEPLKDIENDHYEELSEQLHIKASPLELVKAALHTATPSVLPGRSTEIATVSDFLIDHVINHTPGSLYVSGPPGTGKTATVTKSLTNPKLLDVNVINVNCMRLSTSLAIYKTIYEGLLSDSSKSSNISRISDIKHRILKQITSSTNTIVLVLDEIDQLSSHTQQVLYDIFEWPSLKHSSLVLISIANSLDLTDRLLPRLRANPKTCPQLLHFSPYTSENICEIIKNRLSNLPSIYDKVAIQFCARKVSSVNGDLRKALDISRRAVELVEMEGDGGCVSIKHVARVLEEVYGTSIRESDREDIPLQQKLVACTILLLQKKGISEPTLGKLYEAYFKVCSKQRLKQESNGEFVCLLNMLETKGMIVIRKSKQSVLLSKVRLLLQHDELSHALQDNTLITTILQIQL